MTAPQLVAGNWKMNGLAAAEAEVKALVAVVKGRRGLPDSVVRPAATLIRSFVTAVSDSAVKLGGQTCHPAVSGAHTGDVSAEMLKDAGAGYVIVGHSERRTDHK